MHPVMEAENETHRIEVFPDESPENPRDETNVGTFLTWSRNYNSPDDNAFDDPNEWLDWWYCRGDCNECGERVEVRARDRRYVHMDTGKVTCPPRFDVMGKKLARSMATRGYSIQGATSACQPAPSDGGVFLLVYAYEHGQVAYKAVPATPESGNPYHTRWDSGIVGVIYADGETVEREWGGDPEKFQWAQSYLTGEVERYSQWANGDVYGVVISRKVRKHFEVTTTDDAEITFDEYDRDDWQEVEDGSLWGIYGDTLKEALFCEFPEYAELVAKLS